MCNDKFLSKDADEAWEYLNFFVEISQAKETEDIERSKSISIPLNKGGLIKFGKTKDIIVRLITLAKKLDYLLTKRLEIVKVIGEVQEIYDIYELQGHTTQNCLTLPTFKEVLSEQANSFNAIHQLVNNPYSSIYNLGWKNHLNF